MGGQQSQPDQREQDTPPSGMPQSQGELPQCMMGNRKVDDMRFLISCTNWY